MASNDTNQINLKAWLGLAAVMAAMGLAIFLCAGTLRYWQAWCYLVVHAGCSALITLYLMRNDPTLLERRVRGGPTAEKERLQKIIVTITSFVYVASLVVPALDHRYNGSRMPVWAELAGDALTALSFYLVFRVFRENSFSAATIQIAEGQKVIDTGPYARVRHPMYAGASLLFLAAPLALGSAWGMLAFVAALPVLIWRLLHEERFLADQLPGYKDYCAKVRWRLLPGVF
jgi:protein-S-isoprenylcysteine O-methyltransferase Ste14